MITLPPKFAIENEKSESEPAVIVKIGDSILENIQSSQGDWTNNSSETQVDFSSFPGDVILESDAIPNEENLTGTTQALLLDFATVFEADAKQTFKHQTGDDKTLGVVSIKILILNNNSTMDIRVEILGHGALIQTAAYNAGNPVVLVYDFTSLNILIPNDTEFTFKVDVSQAGINNSCFIIYQNSDVYPRGEFTYTVNLQTPEPPAVLGDLNFSITLLGDYFKSTGTITTQIIDLGETPSNDGEFIIEDIQTEGTITHSARGSTDGFSGSDVSIGSISDGDIISGGDIFRYYKITSILTGTNLSLTPVLQSVGVSFVNYISISNKSFLGFEPSVKKISSLTTEIDDFNLSTIGQITITIGQTPLISNYFDTNFAKNKPVQILQGYVAPGFAESDYLLFYKGIIDDWKMTEDIFSVTIKDNSTSWKVDIPRDESSAGNQTGGTFTSLVAVAENHADVMLDILQNQINARDAEIDIGSFEVAKSARPAYVVTRTVSGDDQQSADDLMNQLRILVGGYFIPQANGQIKIKLFDRDEATIGELTEQDFLVRPNWERNIKALINKTFIEFDFDTGLETYGHVFIGIDVASQSNFVTVESFELQDNWTLDDVGGQGEIQMNDLTNRILTRYADPPSKFSAKIDRKKIAWEVGDMVLITTKQSPSSDLTGVTQEKYQIIRKNFGPIGASIDFTFLRVIPTP